jgi:hypothetical protein
MTINELRVGNLLRRSSLSISTGAEESVVVILGLTHIGNNPYVDVGKPSGRWDPLYDFSPVKLDYETLLKIGFAPSEVDIGSGLKLLRYPGTNLFVSYDSVLENIYMVQLYVSPKYDGPNRKINYAHELQNIFFALFQEELDISPLLIDKL